MAQYYMLYKPRGLLTAKRDARRETVMSCFPEALRETLHPVGRLDRDTEGLLLFTDDGMLDVRLLRPEQHVEKEYEYRAFGLLDETAMRQLEEGVLLLEGQPLSLPARVQAESPVVDRWNEYMKDVMLMEMDPETGAQPLMKQVFFFN